VRLLPAPRQDQPVRRIDLDDLPRYGPAAAADVDPPSASRAPVGLGGRAHPARHLLRLREVLEDDVRARLNPYLADHDAVLTDHRHRQTSPGRALSPPSAAQGCCPRTPRESLESPRGPQVALGRGAALRLAARAPARPRGGPSGAAISPAG